MPKQVRHDIFHRFPCWDTVSRGREGWSGEEVLERHLLDLMQSVASDCILSLSAKEAYHYPNARILKLRNPDHPPLRSSLIVGERGFAPVMGKEKNRRDETRRD